MAPVSVLPEAARQGSSAPTTSAFAGFCLSRGRAVKGAEPHLGTSAPLLPRLPRELPKCHFSALQTSLPASAGTLCVYFFCLLPPAPNFSLFKKMYLCIIEVKYNTLFISGVRPNDLIDI